MHVLTYLRDPHCEEKPDTTLVAEYRLLCSGTLYRCVDGDWSKSEVARMLLDPPLLLFVTNRPFDEYPLELVLHVKVPAVAERQENTTGPVMISYHPDEDVARDLASILTVLCRRLVTVAGKTSEQYSDFPHPLFGSRPFPLPVVTSMRRVYWPRHPTLVNYALEGQTFLDYNPQPKSVDPTTLTRMLLGLPKTQHACSFVTACRLYSVALELIHDRPEISYQMLISSVESMANAALQDYQPSDEAKVEHHNGVYRRALKLGLDLDTARELAVEACKREWWATRKFKKFLLDNTPASIWDESDELFHGMPKEAVPSRCEFERNLGKIYEARSKSTHEGEAFPASASYTGGPFLSLRASVELFNTDAAFPPVVWFERVVNGALCSFLQRSVSESDTLDQTEMS